jgi:hypothetical protein
MVPPVPMPATKMSTVDGRVRGVGELLGQHGTRGVRNDLGGLLDRAAHALGAGGQNEFGSVGAQQRAALLRHGLGHGQDDLVAAGRADHGERDAGVARGALDDGSARGKLARRLGGIDDRDAETVFDARRRVVELELGEHGGPEPRGDAVEANQWSVSEDLGDVVVDAGHGESLI